MVKPSPYAPPIYRFYRGDAVTRIHGSIVPIGERVLVIKYLFRRRVVIEFQGLRLITFTWCLRSV